MLKVPVDFGHEEHLRMRRANGGDDFEPEVRHRRRANIALPSLGENVVGHQHRHVAAQAVALVADVDQCIDERPPQPGMKGVELSRVDPGGEVRIASASDHQLLARRISNRKEVARLRLEVFQRAADKILGMLNQPAMVDRDMIGYEIKNQLDAMCSQPLAEDRQPVAPAQPCLDPIIMQMAKAEPGTSASVISGSA